jgi:hypothetical protein
LPKRRAVSSITSSRVAGSLPVYAFNAGWMVLRTMCRTRPFLFFGLLGSAIMALGILQGLFVFVHWCGTGQTRPFQSVLMGASLFITVGFLILVLALVADMLNRVIVIAERLLFFAKVEQYRGNEEGRKGPESRP